MMTSPSGGRVRASPSKESEFSSVIFRKFCSIRSLTPAFYAGSMLGCSELGLAVLDLEELDVEYEVGVAGDDTACSARAVAKRRLKQGMRDERERAGKNQDQYAAR